MQLQTFVAALAAGLACSAHADWTSSVMTPPGRAGSFGYGLGPNTAVGSMNAANGIPHAALWTSLGSNVAIDLNPAGATESNIIETTGAQHVGNVVIGNVRRAGLWTGNTASSFSSLHPSGYELTYAQGTDGVRQTGLGRTTAGEDRALLWSGSASSVVVLNPPGSNGAASYGMGGGRQVGWAEFAPQFGRTRAGFWSGTAASWTLLDAPGANTSSTAVAISEDGQTQAGYFGGPTGTNWAALWRSTPESFVSLNPGAAFFGSSILGTDNTFQVGWANETGVGVYAGIWEGTAESFLNLGQFLPDRYSTSRAFAVYSTATDVWVFGYAYDPARGFNDAVLWHNSIPAPGTLCIAAGAFAAWSRSRRVPERAAVNRNGE